MAVDVKKPKKGYRKSWNGGKKPDDPRCPRCSSNRYVSPVSVNGMNGDSVWQCTGCADTFEVTAAEYSRIWRDPGAPK